MKRIALLSFSIALVALLAPSLSTAQSFRVKGGANFGSVIGEDAPDDKSLFVGFYLGIAKDFQLSKKIQFQPGMVYSLQGYRWGGNISNRFHFVQMPLNFMFNIGENGGIMAGPQLCVLTRAVSRNVDTDGKYIMTPLIRNVTVALGAGPYIHINDRATLELRAVVDLSKFDGAESLMNLLCVQAGLSFSFNKPETE